MIRRIVTNQTLQDYINAAAARYQEYLRQNPRYSIPFEDEDLINAILDWHSMMGDFDQDELDYLCEEWGLTEHDIDILTRED